MGLRQRQKNTRRRAILEAATQLFLEKGFDATRAEEIAALSEVSIGTLYNYFAGKGDILLTLATQENERIFERIAAYPFDTKKTAREAYCQLFDAYFDPEITFLNRDIWRLGFAISFSDVKTEGARNLREVDRRMADQVVELTKNLKQQNAIRKHVDSRLFGRTLFNNANMLFIEYSRSEKMTMKELRAQVEEMTISLVELVTPGLADISAVEE